jgi:hypothetical protein
MKLKANSNEIIITFYPTINRFEKVFNLIILIIMGLGLILFTYLFLLVNTMGMEIFFH